MRWWRALNSPRGQLWRSAALALCAVVVSVGYFIDDGKPVYGVLWIFLAVAYGSAAVRTRRGLRGRPDERDEAETTS